MTKYLKQLLVLTIAVSVLFTGCAGSAKPSKEDGSKRNTVQNATTRQTDKDNSLKATGVKQNNPAPQPAVDMGKVKPNESGKIMVVMFHNFVESFAPKKYDDGAYTTTFDSFRKLLPELYEKGYRLISVSDLINNNISVPAGCIPMVFTFDDGTAGQFNLVEENGKLAANKNSAVGILEEFNKTHPDFGLKGTFYVNLGLKVFEGKGTVPDRLKYLIDEGFEIGNHTLTHVNLKTEVKTVDVIQKEIGGNQKKMLELIPGYMMKSFALPFGAPSKELEGYVAKGEYQGVKYENFAVMEVGWDPSVSPVDKKFNPLNTHRVRASGIKPVQADLAWWLQKLSRDGQYISDGNPDTVTVPKSKEGDVAQDRLKGKKLVTY